MSLLLGARQGAQRPSLSAEPLGVVSSAGQEAIELAASAGLILDPWQQWCLASSLGEREDGTWAAFECGLIVPRQNGKGALLEARELAGLVLFDEQLIVHSAHKFDTATEHFHRMQQLVETCDDLRRKVKKILGGHGQESIQLRSGARLKFIARSRGAARGFSGDCVVFDEAFNLPPEAIGGMLPALSARPNPQVWYASSAPHADSRVLHALRRRAIEGTDPRLWFAEWGCEPGTAVDDRDGWAQANPAMGIRIPEGFIEAELAAMRDLGEEFPRERLGIPSSEDSGSGVFGPGKWAVCIDTTSRDNGLVAIALDVNDDQGWASFAAAGVRADGLVHLELIERKPGTGWVVAAAKDFADKQGVPIWIDPKGPAASLIPALKADKVPFKELPSGEFPKACVQLQQRVTEGTVRHLGQPPLDSAAASASIRTAGDSWVWARASSSVDISPLVAVTIAVWASAGAKKKPVFASF